MSKIKKKKVLNLYLIGNSLNCSVPGSVACEVFHLTLHFSVHCEHKRVVCSAESANLHLGLMTSQTMLIQSDADFRQI